MLGFEAFLFLGFETLSRPSATLSRGGRGLVCSLPLLGGAMGRGMMCRFDPFLAPEQIPFLAFFLRFLMKKVVVIPRIPGDFPAVNVNDVITQLADKVHV